MTLGLNTQKVCAILAITILRREYAQAGPKSMKTLISYKKNSACSMTRTFWMRLNKEKIPKFIRINRNRLEPTKAAK